MKHVITVRFKQTYNKIDTRLPITNSTGGVSVGYKLKCSDLGLNCSWEGSGNTVEELMMKGAQHAKEAHNMRNMSPDLVAKVKGAVKQV